MTLLNNNNQIASYYCHEIVRTYLCIHYVPVLKGADDTTGTSGFSTYVCLKVMSVPQCLLDLCKGLTFVRSITWHQKKKVRGDSGE